MFQFFFSIIPKKSLSAASMSPHWDLVYDPSGAGIKIQRAKVTGKRRIKLIR